MCSTPWSGAKPACSDEPAVSEIKLNRRGVLFGAGATALAAAAGYGAGQGIRDMPHLALLGDSIFDNAAYVAGGPDVIRQVRDILPPGWGATLQARDGALIGEVAKQLQRVPADASHLVVSVGGNDALGEAALLDATVGSMAEALELLTSVRDRFRSAYAFMLDDVLARGLPLAVCTIYEARFPEPVVRRVAATALATLNDAITREAFARGVDCIDLRIVCDEDSDFANPIEPSTKGGAKIAGAILRFAAPGGTRRSPRVITR